MLKLNLIKLADLSSFLHHFPVAAKTSFQFMAQQR